MPDEQGKSQWKDVPRVFRFPDRNLGRMPAKFLTPSHLPLGGGKDLR